MKSERLKRIVPIVFGVVLVISIGANIYMYRLLNSINGSVSKSQAKVSSMSSELDSVNKQIDTCKQGIETNK